MPQAKQAKITCPSDQELPLSPAATMSRQDSCIDTDLEEALIQKMTELLSEGVVVSFSGGVDSSMVLAAAQKAHKRQPQLRKALALTFKSPFLSQAELQEAQEIAHELEAEHSFLELNSLPDFIVSTHPSDRCYHCKKAVYQQALDFAAQHQYRWVCDGTQIDDKPEARPGMKALSELKIRSPLHELGLGKEQLRQLARQWNLSVAQKPSAPCMATRFAFGEPIKLELIEALAQLERQLSLKSLRQVRLRVLDQARCCKIECDPSCFMQILEHKDELISQLKELGFKQVYLDLQGYRSGSMDEKG